MPANTGERWSEKEMERMYKFVAPMMDEIRKRYNPSLNIDGFEPALSNDVAEICLQVELTARKETKDDIWNQIFQDKNYAGCDVCTKESVCLECLARILGVTSTNI